MKGKRKLPEDLIVIRGAVNRDVIEVIRRMLRFTFKELRSIHPEKMPEATALELAVASILGKAIEYSDYKRFDALLDRIIGKPKFQFEHTGPDGGPIPISNLNDQELNQRLEDFERRLSKYKGKYGPQK